MLSSPSVVVVIAVAVLILLSTTIVAARGSCVMTVGIVGIAIAPMANNLIAEIAIVIVRTSGRHQHRHP